MINEFLHRHIGPNTLEKNQLLQTIGVHSLHDLINETIPIDISKKENLSLPAAMSEYTYLQHIKSISLKNKLYTNFIGMGYYGTITPSVIARNIFENPGWYTQYTPYQAEIAQGRLEALLNYQTMVSDLTGLPIANASLLDEATAAAEAMIMLYNNRPASKSNANQFIIAASCFPQTIEVVKARALPLDISIMVLPHEDITIFDSTFGVLLQYPTAKGCIPNYEPLAAECIKNNCKIVVAADIMSLVVLPPPSVWGADVVVGSTQRFGVPMGFGGPHAAYFACKDEYKRNIPGRIIGISIDRLNNKALRMALQTREQHIRREKATSNICTAQTLLAIMASMYALYHGSEGITRIAKSIHHKTAIINSALKRANIPQLNDKFYDTLAIKVDIEKWKNIAEQLQCNFNYFYQDCVTLSIDESTTIHDLEKLLDIIKRYSGIDKLTGDDITDYLPLRQDKVLTHPIFNTYHSESQMLRYIKKLESRDLSLCTSMIPLGSCTMKLNATSEMIPLSWSHFNAIHPFVPSVQAEGYLEIITNLENYLCSITGFQATSLQPNSGAQGEYAGLLAIRAYHHAQGEPHRNVMLIPASAHGTNPASAVMAGMKVVLIKCTENGDIDFLDLQNKILLHKDNLAGLMVTYPSTHGVFESAIKEICNAIHQSGGLVYMDGANMNAQVGLTSPALIGADVCHINLHKTFAIPHGGGGPGMGPICVNEKLAPYLPGHPVVATGGVNAILPVSAAPYGSASILLISYGYIRMLGFDGLKHSTEVAILNANYIKSRLEPHYSILYIGEKGRCAHEMIIDCREFKSTCNIEVEDIAKRLIDYGFHAPTVSFPIAGTLMIEPTESEDKDELDRFCDAMISIRFELQEIALGIVDKQNNPLKNAPHGIQEAISDQWSHPYSREKACYPIAYLKDNKFWPHVARVNNAHGDRNLVCTCEPISSYEE